MLRVFEKRSEQIYATTPCYFLKCAYEKVRALDIENGVKYSEAKIPIGGKV